MARDSYRLDNDIDTPALDRVKALEEPTNLETRHPANLAKKRQV
jgi:hypothetical protein